MADLIGYLTGFLCLPALTPLLIGLIAYLRSNDGTTARKAILSWRTAGITFGVLILAIIGQMARLG